MWALSNPAVTCARLPSTPLHRSASAPRAVAPAARVSSCGAPHSSRPAPRAPPAQFGSRLPKALQASKLPPRGAAVRRLVLPTMAAAGGAYDTELTHGYEAVALASKLCQKVQRGLGGEEQQDKSDDSPVTVADYGAQAVVCWSLQRAFPDSRLNMVAEEDSSNLAGEENTSMRARITALVNEVVQEVDSAAQLSVEDVMALIDLGTHPGGSEGRHWVLDPIDGTRGFVGGRQYAVCLGMIQEGEVVLGVLGCPNLPMAALTDEDGTAAASASIGAEGVGVCFAAQQGQGAYYGAIYEGMPGTPMRMVDSADFATARFMESYESRHSLHGTTQAVAEHLGIAAQPLRLDSQCKYGALARGDATLYMRFPPKGYREKIWDHAAGVVIVQEAGGKVSDAAGNKLDFSKGRWLDLEGGGIVGAPVAMHTKLVEAIAAVAE